MKRFALVPAIALAALACQDEQLPTDGTDPSLSTSITASAEEDAGEIRELIRELFPERGLETAALAQFGNVERKVEEGNLEEARAKAFDLIDFTLEKLEKGQLEEPDEGTTAEAVSELIDLLLAFVGLEAPEVSPSVLSGETDGVVAIAFPDEDNLIVTENEFAGTFIQTGAVDEETIVVVERLDPTAQEDGDCLPVGTEQREGCYRFDKTPDDPFNEDVLVAVCPEEGIRNETDADFEEFQLAKFDPANPDLGVVGLPSASEDFLDCSDFGTLAAAAGQGALGRLAGAGWSATGGRLLRWLGPAPVRAVNLGFGGTTADFSRIGWARLAEVQIASGDDQSDFTGFRVDANPTVQVSPVHPPSTNTVLGDRDVTFTVAQGDGTVDDPGTAGDDRLNSVTVSTDANGQAAVPWRLGTAGTNELEAAVAGDTVAFTATADAPQLPIQSQCTGGGGSDRVLNPRNENPVGRAFYVPGYPESNLGQVDLWISTGAQSSASFGVELTVVEGGFDGDTLGADLAFVQVPGGEANFVQATFEFDIDDITPGSTVAFHPVTVDAPDVVVFMEVPESDPDPQFPFDGDAGCPIIETVDATAPLSTDRRQGVRTTISAGN